MASAATISSSEPEPPKVHASDISSIKTFAESKGTSPIPSAYHSITELHDDIADELAASMPVIDLSLLTSHDPQIHAKAVHQLGKACAEWGVFMVSKFCFKIFFFYTLVLINFTLTFIHSLLSSQITKFPRSLWRR